MCTSRRKVSDPHGPQRAQPSPPAGTLHVPGERSAGRGSPALRAFPQAQLSRWPLPGPGCLSVAVVQTPG